MLLKLSNINKSFGSADTRNYKQVLNDISLELEKARTLAILGPSGSGKSTLLNIIGALDTPDSLFSMIFHYIIKLKNSWPHSETRKLVLFSSRITSCRNVMC